MHQNIAAEQMYQFYKANKANLPSNINHQRDFIINSLCRGEEIAGVFAAATLHAEAAAKLTQHKPKKRKK